ncbi:MAG TPA: sigma 54-interacting transcriptional regulator [Nitrospiraceae bacterium]|jgi:formate hydrogenlyase transcriptional activator|nr:sigma 54-interacting transcriptional regulator [Nitrospiraceae bacterium]
MRDQNPDQSCAETPTSRYCALLGVSEAIAAHRDLSALFHDLAKRLPSVVPFEFIGLILHDPDRHVMRVHVLEATEEAKRIALGMELPVEESAGGWVWTHQRPLVVPCTQEEKRFPKATAPLRQMGVASFVMVPLTTALRRLGAMGFGSLTPCAFGEEEIDFLQQVAKQVAVAVDNVLNYERAQTAQQQLTRERDRLRLLLEINNAVVSRLDLKDLFGAIATCLRKTIPHDYTSLALYEPERNGFVVYALDFPAGKGFITEGLHTTLDTPAGEAFRAGQPFVVVPGEIGRCQSDFGQRAAAEGLKTACCLPLLSGERKLGTLNVARLRDEPFTPEDVELLGQAASQIAIAVDNALTHEEVQKLKDKLAKEKLYLEDEIRTEHNFEEIVGDSAVLKKVLKQVEIVAPTDSTVLIFGETGTGKELLARAIHSLSGRRNRTFVKMNCAAIPSGLLESELFGHEKGAFTGAITQKIGRFELADGGTLFLDEVGDIPLELQSKLLRVLQEQEFERLGSNKTIKVNVRLVAATNRNLGQMVTEKQFRSDLYYRLNVFPLTVPALRERREDIPLLVRYFTQKFARRMNKRIETVPTETMEALTRYHWPGNVRELENLIERAVILSEGPELYVPVAELKRPPAETDRQEETQSLVTLEAAEREHILRALREANWVIGGPSGAAAKLGMKRTTLQSKMQKLGIARPQ